MHCKVSVLPLCVYMYVTLSVCGHVCVHVYMYNLCVISGRMYMHVYCERVYLYSVIYYKLYQFEIIMYSQSFKTIFTAIITVLQ